MSELGTELQGIQFSQNRVRPQNPQYFISHQSSRGKLCNRVKFEWKKLEDPVTKEQFQIELINRAEVLQCTEPTLPISER